MILPEAQPMLSAPLNVTSPGRHIGASRQTWPKAKNSQRLGSRRGGQRDELFWAQRAGNQNWVPITLYVLGVVALSFVFAPSPAKAVSGLAYGNGGTRKNCYQHKYFTWLCSVDGTKGHKESLITQGSIFPSQIRNVLCLIFIQLA